MAGDAPITDQKRPYDLHERTALFGESINKLCRSVKVTPVTGVLIRQLVRAGTSVGANHEEADDADTKKDFRYKIGLCKREAKESRYWLRQLKVALPEQVEVLEPLRQEARELTLIFAAIVRSSSIP
jgi:four helix bundle protein